MKGNEYKLKFYIYYTKTNKYKKELRIRKKLKKINLKKNKIDFLRFHQFTSHFLRLFEIPEIFYFRKF